MPCEIRCAEATHTTWWIKSKFQIGLKWSNATHQITSDITAFIAIECVIVQFDLNPVSCAKKEALLHVKSSLILLLPRHVIRLWWFHWGIRNVLLEGFQSSCTLSILQIVMMCKFGCNQRDEAYYNTLNNRFQIRSSSPSAPHLRHTRDKIPISRGRSKYVKICNNTFRDYNIMSNQWSKFVSQFTSSGRSSMCTARCTITKSLSIASRSFICSVSLWTE